MNRRKQRRNALQFLDSALSGEAKPEQIGALAVHSLLEQMLSRAVTVWQWRGNSLAQDTVQEIADKLVISERTVRTHVSNILRKPHLANRTQAALYALQEGLANLDEANRLM